MAKLLIDHFWYEWEEETISGNKIKKMLALQGRKGYEDREFSFTTSNMRSPSTLPDSEEITIGNDAIVHLTTFPKNTHYGADLKLLPDAGFNNLTLREKFIMAQVFQVSERYFFRNGNPVFLSKDCDFLVINDFPVPPLGDWLSRTTTICVYFPNNYPQKAPVGFFVDSRMKLKYKGESHLIHGTAVYAEPNKFYKTFGLEKKGYSFFCWHVEQGWRPDLSNPFLPDNLDSFLKNAQRAFDSRAVGQKRKVIKIY